MQTVTTVLSWQPFLTILLPVSVRTSVIASSSQACTPAATTAVLLLLHGSGIRQNPDACVTDTCEKIRDFLFLFPISPSPLSVELEHLHHTARQQREETGVPEGQGTLPFLDFPSGWVRSVDTRPGSQQNVASLPSRKRRQEGETNPILDPDCDSTRLPFSPKSVCVI